MDTTSQCSGVELLEAVANAERERAASPSESPLGEWEVIRIRPDLDLSVQLRSQALLSSPQEARDALQVCKNPTIAPAIP